MRRVPLRTWRSYPRKTREPKKAGTWQASRANISKQHQHQEQQSGNLDNEQRAEFEGVV